MKKDNKSAVSHTNKSISIWEASGVICICMYTSYYVCRVPTSSILCKSLPSCYLIWVILSSFYPSPHTTLVALAPWRSCAFVSCWYFWLNLTTMAHRRVTAGKYRGQLMSSEERRQEETEWASEYRSPPYKCARSVWCAFQRSLVSCCCSICYWKFPMEFVYLSRCYVATPSGRSLPDTKML